MADTSVSYKCPSCGAPLGYSPGRGDRIKCEYCETEFAVKDLDAYFAEAEQLAAKAQAAKESKWQNTSETEQWDAESATIMRAMTCSSCGAEIVCDNNTMATECVYCGNPTMVPGRFEGGLMPDYIIPFKKTKAEAVAAMKEFYKGKWLLPSNYASTSRLEKIQGMYVPFWLYTSMVESSAEFEATSSRSWDDGDETITETKHYRCSRIGNMDFCRVPVDGSVKMEDTYMESIEPFDYADVQPFSTTYMAGYLADKYDVDAEQAQVKADKRMENSAMANLAATVRGYDTVELQEGHINKSDTSVDYAMVPVWILSSTYQGKQYTFMMNGQTGKFVGRLPIDTKKGFLYGGLAGLVSLPLTYGIAKFVLWAIGWFD